MKAKKSIVESARRTEKVTLNESHYAHLVSTL